MGDVLCAQNDPSSELQRYNKHSKNKVVLVSNPRAESGLETGGPVEGS